MHRWLSILLLVLLPLQVAWAQAADYDAQGNGSHEMHFGHHDHGHGDPHDAVGDEADPGGETFDADGHHCHGQCSVMPTQARVVPALLTSNSPALRSDVHGGADAPPRPERPQWARLA